MKKITALLLALVMVFALCACGGDDNKTEGGDADDALKALFSCMTRIPPTTLTS